MEYVPNLPDSKLSKCILGIHVTFFKTKEKMKNQYIKVISNIQL